MNDIDLNDCFSCRISQPSPLEGPLHMPHRFASYFTEKIGTCIFSSTKWSSFFDLRCFDFTGDDKGQLIAPSHFTESDIYPSDHDSVATLVYSCDDDASSRASPLMESPKKRSFEDFEVLSTSMYIVEFLDLDSLILFAFSSNRSLIRRLIFQFHPIGT